MPEDPLPEMVGDLAQLTKALAAAQGDFPTIEKKATANVQGRDGKQGYSYKYADIGDVLAAVRPVLSKHGLALTQRTKPGQGGTLLLTELRHESGEILDSEITITASPANPQQFGGSLTYLRRYEVVTLLGIAAEEDRDAQDVEPDRPRASNGNGQPAWAKPATRARVGELGVALAPLLGRERAAAIARSVKDSIGNIPDGFVGVAKLIATYQGQALEATGMLDSHQRELQVQAEEAAKIAGDAKAAAEAQEQSGEPDPADAGPYGGVTDDMPDDGGGTPDAPARDADGDPLPPAAGTIDKPTIEEGETEADLHERFEQAGCICASPLAPDDDKTAHDDNCPIKGHGIPF